MSGGYPALASNENDMQEETPEQCAQFHADNRTERMERAYTALGALPADEAGAVIAAYRRSSLQPVRTWVASYYKRLLQQLKSH